METATGWRSGRNGGSLSRGAFGALLIAGPMLVAAPTWKRAISDLQEMTFFDFERGLPVLERFGIELQPAGSAPDERSAGA